MLTQSLLDHLPWSSIEKSVWISPNNEVHGSADVSLALTPHQPTRTPRFEYRRPTPMDSLPLELHAQIFEFACTDDGSTARALSLVSRYVRDVAAPYLYQSLAVSGLDQMTELVARLEDRPAHLRRVRHLFLSDWTPMDVQKQVLRFKEMERYDAEKALAARILDLTAPTLETLALVVSCPYTAPPLVGQLFSTRLPRLVELSVNGFYPFPHTSGTMPRLERLHLSGNRNPHGLLQLGALEAACPSLTHLRLSDIAIAAPFARELHAAALPPDNDNSLSDLSPFPSALPPLLRHLVVEVQRLQEPVRHRCQLRRGTHTAHDKMITLLREVETRRRDTRLETMSVVEKEGSEMYEVLKRSWLGSLEGGRLGW